MNVEVSAAAAAVAPLRVLPASQLLESIVNVTEHQDCARFRRSLASTLRELIPMREIAFLRPANGGGYRIQEHDSGGERPSRLPALLDGGGLLAADGLQELLQQGHRRIALPGDCLVLVPVLHRDTLLEIVAVRAAAVGDEGLFVIKAFARLYRNFLALMLESERDPLTGLLNRRTLEARLGASLHQASLQFGSPFASAEAERRGDPPLQSFLAVVDIDHFKRINDTLGHLFGDEVILLVAQLLHQAFREDDALFRYGGEEFVVLVQAQTPDGALAALERFRRGVAEHRFPQLDRVTVSIGFVRIAGDEGSSAIIGRADQALYFAKSHGRNRVCNFDRLAAAGEIESPQRYGDVELF